MSNAPLQLCKQHRQEPNHSHFDPNNCDYCRVERKLATMTAAKNEAVEALKGCRDILAIEHTKADERHPARIGLNKLIAKLEEVE